MILMNNNNLFYKPLRSTFHVKIFPEIYKSGWNFKGAEYQHICSNTIEIYLKVVTFIQKHFKNQKIFERCLFTFEYILMRIRPKRCVKKLLLYFS